MPEKIGVYIDESCCAPLLNAEELAGFVKKKFGDAVSVAKTHPRLSSEDGRNLIQADIDAGLVDAVCICGSSPRVDWDIFDFGGKILVDRVNLREQCVLSFRNPDGSRPAAGEPAPELLTVLAQEYVQMGVAKLTKSNLPEPEAVEAVKTILVLGGGWTGLNAALNAATAGHEVVLVEKAAQLGGKAAQYWKSFPMAYPWTEMQDTGLDKLVSAVTANPKIKVFTGATLTKLSGAPAKYEAELSNGQTLPVGAVVLATGWKTQDTGYLKPLGYGAIKNVITAEEFEALAAKGEIVRPSDGKKVTSVAFITDVSICTAKAWAPKPEGEESDFAADQPVAKDEKKEGEEEGFKYENMESCKHLAYSNELGSLVALKQARYVTAKNPEASAYIFYDHMMVPGINERWYRAAQDEPGVMLTKGTISGIAQDGAGGLVVSATDTLLGENIELAADLVVLPTGMVPTTALEPILNLQYRQGPAFPDLKLFDGFADSNYICFPYETRRTGIYAAGCVRQPMTMSLAREDAQGAVLKAIQCVSSANRGVSVHPRAGDQSYPKFNFVRCTQCKRCTEECPFGALDDDPKGTPMPNPTRCRRCGTCMGACPERVISFDNYNVDQIGTMIKQIGVPPKIDQGGPRALILACENDAYPALDMAAMRGKGWSPYVRFVSVRCLGSVNTIWIADAMSKGVDGVLLLGCKYGDDYQCHFVKGSELCNRRMVNVAETLNRLGIEPQRVMQAQVAIDEYDQIPQIIDDFMDAVLKLGPNPFKGY